MLIAHGEEGLGPDPRPYPRHLRHPPSAAGAVGNVGTDIGPLLTVEPGAEVRTGGMSSQDAQGYARFPSSRLARLRAVCRRDITVPRGTPWTSPISA